LTRGPLQSGCRWGLLLAFSPFFVGVFPDGFASDDIHFSESLWE
jgi:hypothetical protein